MSFADRLPVVAAGLSGCLGVALSAAASHLTGGGQLQTAAQFLLFHAPALLAIPALAASSLLHPRLARAAGVLLVLGLALFCGDLSRRAFAGLSLAPMAAPAGGLLLMAGWLATALAGILRPRR
ncbi:DUF423 domain-containing protein [Microvirga thermotolerans]|uniref:DUF423 domain-containing protein n=1 Tax=Microvirga thermotolerans TaxID=2651334 RepID=A0A5P9K154_9HYPH|nr:DUF423 domain-containing protein [Microvirga thermotolerans]QFU17410.1 DUF423 domain-containing protein [Microvirga thermotolerans]